MPTPVLLLAEDNDLDAKLLEQLIEHCGGMFRFMRVNDGAAAIEYLLGSGQYSDQEKYPVPNLVLLDLKMPNKDGFEVLQWRQSHTEFARLPIIVYSSSYSPEDVEHAYALGANSYVVKPSEPVRLERFVKTLQAWWSDLNLTEGHD
jgi:CheY-like chemotaxis protein